MSTQAVTWAVGAHDVTPTQQFVLVVIAHHYSELHRSCWPSQATLVAETKLSRATLNVALSALVEKGLIAKTSGKKNARNNRYRLPGYEAQSGEKSASSVQQVDTMCPGAGHKTIKKQKTKSKEESKEAPTGAAPKSGETMKLPKGMKVSDIAAAAKSEYTGITDEKILAVPRVNNRLTADGLVKCWRAAHGVYVQGFQPLVRDKERGQLLTAYKRVGDVLPQLILTVLKDWKAFTVHAEKEAAAFKSPSKPTIAYFVRYVDSAAGLELKLEEKANAPQPKTVTEHYATVAAKKAAKPPVQLIAPSTLVNKKLTVADIEEALGDAD